MENRKILAAIFISVIFLPVPRETVAYEPQTTHAALAEEAIKLFNSVSPGKISESSESRQIINGSVDEDSGTRPLHHFFDPINNTGLILTRGKASAWGFAALSFSSSKDWAKNTKEQAGADAILLGTVFSYFSAETDFSWPRAIYDYTWGDKERALKALGHILHLVADATVPDHTRNDPHPPFAEGLLHQSSPYEKWAGQFNKENIKEKGGIVIGGLSVTDMASLDEYFTSTANYSNNNFFSKDTIENSAYAKPVIARAVKKTLKNGLVYNFGLDDAGMHLAVIAKTFDKDSGEITKSYSLVDPDGLVLGDYWKRLSRKAVENAAGIIVLFFREVAYEKENKYLLELNRSWLEKTIRTAVEIGQKLSGKVLGLAAAIGIFDAKPTPEPTEIPDAPKSETEIAAIPKKPPTEKMAEPSEKTVKPKPIEPQIPDEKPKKTDTKPPTPELSPPPLGRFIGGGGAPPPMAAAAALAANLAALETSSSTSETAPTATSTAAATTTETASPATTTPTLFEEVSPDDYIPDVIPPNVSLAVGECGSAATSTCIITATSTAISWSSTSTDLHHFNLDCEFESSRCFGFPAATTSTTTLAFTGTTSVIYLFSASAVDNSGNKSPTTTINFTFAPAEAGTTSPSQIITDTGTTTASSTESAQATSTPVAEFSGNAGDTENSNAEEPAAGSENPPQDFSGAPSETETPEDNSGQTAEDSIPEEDASSGASDSSGLPPGDMTL